MSGSRARTSNSVSLFPFLAVLVCAMGALIFLLIVITQRIRSEALARAVAAREVEQIREQPIHPPLAEPELSPRINPQIVESDPVIISEPELPKEPDRIEPIPGWVELGPAQLTPVLPPKIVIPPPPPPPPEPEPEPIWPAAIAEKPAPPDPNLPLRAELAKLQAARQAWREFVKKKEETTAKLKQQVEELTASLKKLNSQIESVAKQRLEDRKTERELEQSRKNILGQLAKVEQELEDTENRVAGSPTKFQVVPFDGQTGTNYRPIIIECTAAGMRFQPEGVLLTQSDFDGFTLGKNPLLAGAQALSDYWMKASVRSGGKEPEPYVLLIVRPSGSKYYAARQLLEALDRPFGYELVEENLPLDIPPVDPVAAELCRNAVESTLKERDDLKKLLATHGPEGFGRNPKYRVIRKPGGGFDVESARNNPFDEPGLGGTQDRSSGGFPATDRYGQPYRDVPGYETGRGRFPQSNREGTGTGEQSENLQGDFPGSGPSPNAASPNAIPNRPGDGLGRNFADPNEPGRLPADLIRRSQSNLPYRPDEAEPNVSRSNSAKPDTQDSQAQTMGNGRLPNHAANSQFNAGREESREGAVEDPLVNNSPNGTANGTLSPNGPVKPGQSANPSQANSTNQTRTSPSVTDLENNPQNANSTQPPPEGTPNPGTTPGGGGQPGAPTSSYEPAMPNFLSMNSRRSLNRTEPYQRRWGLSDPRASIGFEREITVRVEANRLVVGNAFAVTYNDRTTQDQLGAGLLEAIERTVRKWGRPPMSFYWVPTIQFEVGREQVPVYQELNQTAKSWGLETNAKAIEN